MRIHPFPATHPTHTGHATVMERMSLRLHTMAIAAGFLLRFCALSIIAFLLVSTPLSMREVPYAGHRPSPSH